MKRTGFVIAALLLFFIILFVLAHHTDMESLVQWLHH